MDFYSEPAGPNELAFLRGGGEMGALMRRYDWSTTSLGSPEEWPQSLRTTLSIILNSKFRMFLFWGPELLCFYNDAYRPSLGEGNKRFTTLGQPGAQVWPEIWPIIKPQIDQVMAGGEATWHEDKPGAIYRNGRLENVYWTYSYSPVQDEQGQVAGVFVTCMETTQKVGIARQVAISENRFRRLVEQAPSAVALFSGPRFVITLANERVLEYWGRTYEQVIDKPLFEALPETSGQGLEELLTGVYTTGQRFVASELSVTLERKGVLAPTYIDFVYEPFYEDDGSITGVLVICNEVTEKVKVRQQIQTSQQQLYNLLMQAPIAIAIFRGPTYIVELVNEAHLRLWGRTAGQVLNKPLFEVIPESQGQGYEELLANVLATGEPFYDSERSAQLIRHGQAQTIYFDFVYQPLRELDGTITGVMVVANEITKQVQARQERQRNEAHFRQLVEQAPVATCLFVGRELRIDVANEPMLSFWGKGKEPLGKPLAEALPELQEQPFLAILNGIFITGKTYSAQSMRTDLNVNGVLGTYYFDFIYKPLFDENGDVYAIMDMAVDVTQQVRAQQVIQQSETQKTFLLQLTDRVRTLADPAAIYYEAACLLGEYLGADRVGYAEDQNDGETITVKRNYVRDVADLQGSYRYADFGPLMSQFLAGKTVVRPDIANDPTLTDAEKEAHRVLQLGATVNKPLLREGKVLTVLFMHYKTAHDWSANELSLLDEVADRIVGAADRAHTEQALRQSEQQYRTLSEELEQRVQQRTHELMQANQDLLRSNENLQQFAYVASHDLQEPLRKIQSFSSILEQRYREQLGQEGTEFLQRMTSASARMSTLIRDLLAYSRIATRQQVFDWVSLHAIVTDVLGTLDWEITQRGAQIELETLPAVRGDKSQLGQLFQNLVTNAIKFTPEEAAPHIRISSRRRDRHELPGQVRPTSEATTFTEISVRDHGIGFDVRYLDRIFQVFQRLHGKNQYPGTGIGLAICQRVVENHGGGITATSQPGEGATFCVYLPD